MFNEFFVRSNSNKSWCQNLKIPIKELIGTFGSKEFIYWYFLNVNHKKIKCVSNLCCILSFNESNSSFKEKCTKERQIRSDRMLRKAKRIQDRRKELQQKKSNLLEQFNVLNRQTKPWQDSNEKRGLWRCEDELEYLTSKIRNHFINRR